MLKKLFYYDMKAISPILIISHGALLFISLLYFFISNVLQININDNWILGIYASLLILLLACLCIFSQIYPGVRYYKNIYSDEGYLTNTLPVTPSQIIISKILAGTLWSIIDLIIFGICLLLLIGNQMIPFVSSIFQILGENHWFLAAFLSVLMLLFSLVANLLMIYCSIAIGSFFRGHRVLGAVGGYFILYLLNEILGLVICFAFFLQFNFFREASAVTFAIQPSQDDIKTAIYLFLAILIILQLILGTIYYVFCHYTLKRKLNLD